MNKSPAPTLFSAYFTRWTQLVGAVAILSLMALIVVAVSTNCSSYPQPLSSEELEKTPTTSPNSGLYQIQKACPSPSPYADCPTPARLDTSTDTTSTTSNPDEISTSLDFFKDDYKGLALGVFDPRNLWEGFGRFVHVFVKWEPNSGEVIYATIRRASEQNKFALISWEPKPTPRADGSTNPQDYEILDRIGKGEYDSLIIDVARTVRDLDEYVILRFAHEMDLPTSELHPWAGHPPELFIKAHRRIVEIFRAEGADKVRWLWSPGGYLDGAGNFVSGRWYPGDEYVDMTGITLLLFWRWEETDEKKAREHWVPTPKELIKPKYDALVTYGKPIVVPEMGIDLHPSKRSEEVPWMIELLSLMKTEFTKVRALAYFNDPHNKPDYDADWRLSLTSLKAILEALEGDPYYDMGPESLENP